MIKAAARQAQDKRLWGLALLASTLVLASCASPGGRHGGPPLPPTANPSSVVAAELAFARLARERGQWTAFAQYAAPDALMFVPAPVNAQTWLKGQANPAQTVKWQPHQVWSSCDGSLAVAKGAWQQGDGTSGYFTTIWQRQEDGSLKWVLDQGDTLDQPLGEPEMVSGQVADCDPVTSNVITMPRGQNSDGRFYFDGHAKEDSLSWTITVEPDLSRVLRVYMWQDKEMREVLTSSVAAPAS